MKIKSIAVGLGILLVFNGVCFSQSVNDIELTTYYPAPYGDYDMLSLTPSNGPPVATASDGMIYFDDGTTNEKGLHTYDSAIPGWEHFGAVYGVPSGTVVAWAGSIANKPTGWLVCNGAAVSRTTYSKLFAALGGKHGVGDGSSTFNLPDLRDRFVVGANQDSSNVAKSNITGTSLQKGGNTSHHHSIGNHTHPLSGSTGSYSNTKESVVSVDGVTYHKWGWAVYHSNHSHSLSGRSTSGASGNTGPQKHIPRFYALCYIIKT